MGRELCGMFITTAHYGENAGNSRTLIEGSLREIASFCTLLGFNANYAAESMPPLQSLSYETLRRREAFSAELLRAAALRC